MVFSVSIDARAIEECKSCGKAGLSVVASLLNSLDQNCLLIERRKSTFSYESLINTVDDLVDSFANDGADFLTRNRIKNTLKKMRVTDRVKSFRSEESSDPPEQSEEIMASLVNVVDQLIVAESCDQVALNMVRLLGFPISSFESRRSKACSEGVSKKDRECDVFDLFNPAFRTLLLWSDRVELIDYSLGQNWLNKFGQRNDNYADAIPYWRSFFKSLGRKMVIVITTVAPREYDAIGRDDLEAEIKKEFMIGLEGTGIQVKVETGGRKVHSRFLHSCGFFIDIDRGIDICYRDGKVRKTSFGFKTDEELRSPARR